MLYRFFLLKIFFFCGLFFLGGECDESPTLPAIAGWWEWLGDSSRERCPPVLPSIKKPWPCWCGCCLFAPDWFCVYLDLFIS